MGGKECPTCNSYLFKDNTLNTNRVYCVYCRKSGYKYDICWKCLKPWKGSLTSLCGNINCGGVKEKN